MRRVKEYNGSNRLLILLKFYRRISLPGSYTVETAGVMAVVLFTLMILLDQAFHVRAETVGEFAVHEAVERERHEIAHSEEKEISRQNSGMRWSIDLTIPVFRPEESLRMWSLMGGNQ